MTYPFTNNYANFTTVYRAQSKVEISGSTNFIKNTGSFYASSTNMSITGTAYFAGNRHLLLNASIEEGGALTSFQSNVFFKNQTIFTNNTSNFGGAIFATESEFYNYGELVISNNRALHSGGGVYMYMTGMNLKTASVTVEYNVARYFAGGMYILSSILRLFGGTLEIFRNSADRGSGGGIGIKLSGKLYVIKEQPECNKSDICNTNQSN